MPHHFTTDVITRFWAKVSKTDTCWLWTACTTHRGYGRLQVDGHALLAHRIAYALAYAPPPNDMLVCHHCDNPTCVRPDHLFLGTPLDNRTDCIRKGRNPTGDQHWARVKPDHLARGAQSGACTMPERRPRGEKHGMARLTIEQVRDIRRRFDCGESSHHIALDYPVTQQNIISIIQRKTWKHI